LAHLEPILLGPRLDRFLAPHHRLADRLEAHALAGEAVEFLDLVAGPRLAVALEIFGQFNILPDTRWIPAFAGMTEKGRLASRARRARASRTWPNSRTTSISSTDRAT